MKPIQNNWFLCSSVWVEGTFFCDLRQQNFCSNANHSRSFLIQAKKEAAQKGKQHKFFDQLSAAWFWFHVNHWAKLVAKCVKNFAWIYIDFEFNKMKKLKLEVNSTGLRQQRFSNWLPFTILVVREAISTKDLLKKREQLFIILCFSFSALNMKKIRMQKGMKKRIF